MKVKLYCVLDNASGVYDGPVPNHNDGVALRAFTNIATNPEHPVGRNPECFSLWRVGEWNDATAEIIPEPKHCVAYAIDIIPRDNNGDADA
ncbi:putative nonstructural protein [Eel River basin pequenovirus]|nr:putative nonstructural protein [Eel River basin pequenovirus]